MNRCVLCLFVLLACSLTSQAEEEWRTFRNKEGKAFAGRVTSIDKKAKKVTVELKKGGKKATLDFSVFSPLDQEYLNFYEAPEKPDPKHASEAEDEAGISKKLYPHAKSEVRAMVKSIDSRPTGKGIDDTQQAAVNLLNVHRFLAGVPHDVEANPKKVAEATAAAKACAAKGGLSHSIGSFTNKCNLTSGGNIVRSVTGYINDGGANNRAQRGHRKWCLNPKMQLTGFGTAGKSYSAMWAVDGSRKTKARIKDFWAYPGRGFFPKEYLHGSGWSVYLPGKAPTKDALTITVHKLAKRPEKKFGLADPIPGRQIEIEYVHTFSNAINFEPKLNQKRKTGIYWVTLEAKGLKLAYVVEIF